MPRLMRGLPMSTISEELLEGTGLAMLNINLTSLVIIVIQYYCSKVLLYYIRQELLSRSG